MNVTTTNWIDGVQPVKFALEAHEIITEKTQPLEDVVYWLSRYFCVLLKRNDEQ